MVKFHILSLPLLPACSLGCYGEQRFATPNFDRLASKAVLCNHYYSNEILSLDSLPNVTLHRWSVPQPELKTLLSAAESWLNEEELEQLYSADEYSTLAGSIERLRQICPARLWPTLEVTATALSYDEALGEWLNGISFADGDLVVVVGESGDPRRIPETRDEWLSVVSEPVVHLPLLFHFTGQEEHLRIDRLISTRDLRSEILRLASESSHDRANLFSSASELEVHWDLAECRAARTADWLIVERKNGDASGGDQEEIALFRKPEDLWEMLNVASQYPVLIDEFLKRGSLLPAPHSDEEASSEED